MTFLQSLLLGIVQGLTEFIPVSSTAHLILVPWVLGWSIDRDTAFVFDVLLQWGTVLAVIVYFWRDLWNIARAVVIGLLQRQPFASTEARLGWFIVLATLPAVVLGLLLKDLVEGLHRNPIAVATIVLFGAALLFGSERLGQRTRTLASLTWRDAVIIGSSQALALLPGVSRSAATICGGLVRNLERPAAARFSFLMSVPVLLGAGVVALKDLVEVPNFSAYVPNLFAGVVAAAIVGFACIHWLLGFLARRPLHVFGWYRVVVGVACLVFAFFQQK